MSVQADSFYHVANQHDYEQSLVGEQYTCASLEGEGFIHCCFKEQLSGVIDRYYRNAPNVLLFTIVVSDLTEEVKYENTVGGTELFPHIYGAINMSAVSKIEELDTSLPEG